MAFECSAIISSSNDYGDYLLCTSSISALPARQTSDSAGAIASKSLALRRKGPRPTTALQIGQAPN